MKTIILSMALVLGLVSCGTANNSSDLNSGTGSYINADINSAEILEAAEFAVAKVNEEKGSRYPFTFVKVISAEKQLVAGMNYKLKIKMEQNSYPAYLEAVVFSQAWTNTMELKFHVIALP